MHIPALDIQLIHIIILLPDNRVLVTRKSWFEKQWVFLPWEVSFSTEKIKSISIRNVIENSLLNHFGIKLSQIKSMSINVGENSSKSGYTLTNIELIKIQQTVGMRVPKGLDLLALTMEQISQIILKKTLKIREDSIECINIAEAFYGDIIYGYKPLYK